MSSNNRSSSDSSAGGAPLRSPLPPQSTTMTNPTSEEELLLRGSREFEATTNPNDPFTGGSLPQSVPPGNYNRYGPGPTFNRQPLGRRLPGQPGTRYRQSFSNAMPRNGGFNYDDGNQSPASDNPQQPLFGFHHALMSATQYVNLTPGIDQTTATRHSEMLRDASQLASRVLVDVMAARDRAFRERDEEREKLQHDYYTERKERDESQQSLKQAIERENLLKGHIDDLKKQVDFVNGRLMRVIEETKRFQSHHARVTSDYKEQDSKNFQHINELEGQVRTLRQQNSELSLAAGIQGGESSSYGEEFSPTAFSNSRSRQGKSRAREKGGISREDTAVHMKSSRNSADRDRTSDGAGSSFIPNPKAPSWAPTPSRHGKHAHSNVASQEEEGRAEHSRALVIRPSDHSGDATSSNSDSSPAWSGLPEASPLPFNDALSANVDMSRPIPKGEPNWEASDVQVAFVHLYDLCRGYVTNAHGRGPSRVPFKQLRVQDGNTWDYLMNLAYGHSQDSVYHLEFLASQSTSYPYLILRTVVDYLFKRLVQPCIFLGFSSEKDPHMRALQEKIQGFAGERGGVRSANRARQRVIEEHSRLVNSIVADASWPDFRAEMIDRHAILLGYFLQPMCSVGVSNEAATKSLKLIMAFTLDIAVGVWTSRTTLHFAFPDCGCKFAVGNMAALNAGQFARTQDELQFSQTRISLVVTPTLTIRDDREGTLLRVTNIHKAQVLLMK
ncbi:hypothetical protein F5Y15DRAFT_426401 [Xylariaceae sp. FL0016]|nr:hypothetical protein F5Y15DRAFT_426401 [Xylariaceae sp. FL0016]